MMVEPLFSLAMNHIKQSLRWLLALALGANALWMLAEPRQWYDTIPGVVLTGGFNQHFVQDIGCAYLASAVGLAWRARLPSAWPAAMLASLFLLLHGGLHVVDLWQGRCSPDGFLRDAPAVIIPALAALWLAWPAAARAAAVARQADSSTATPATSPIRSSP
jgi:hypothetical protein